jgi:hypothetical protein
VAEFTITTVNGMRVFAVAAGSIANPPGFRLLIVDTVTWPWAAVEVMPNE